MKIELSNKAVEILNYMAELHYTDINFLLDQIIIFNIEGLLSSAKYITPEKRGNLFEDSEYPCAVNVTIDDCFAEFKELRKELDTNLGIKVPSQMNLFRDILKEKLSMN